MNPFNNIMKQPKGLSFANIFGNPRLQQAGPGTNPMPANSLAGQGGDAYGLNLPGTGGAQPAGLPPLAGPSGQQSNPYQDLLNLLHGTDSKRAMNPWLDLIKNGRSWK